MVSAQLTSRFWEFREQCLFWFCYVDFTSFREEQVAFCVLFCHWSPGLVSGMAESGSETWTRVCGRCFQLSRSTIVHCKSSVVPGGIDLCVRCHYFVHPGCVQQGGASSTKRKKTVRPSCSVCRGLNATLCCPLCPSADGDLYGAQLCAECSAWLHSADHKMCHVDHIVLLNA